MGPLPRYLGIPRNFQKTGARDPALRPIVRELQFAGAKLEAQIVVWIVSKTTNKISRDS